MNDYAGKFLHQINSPADLRKLHPDNLMEVCSELRQFIIEEVSNNPAHFGASLGVVELTVALHYIFDTPYDKLVWDVGHQAYGHKILTGRRDSFHTNRKYGGISGFPKPEESKFDAFGVGHSSTSISAALGMAAASQQLKEDDRHFVAVIGDGSLTGGMAFEGMNNAGMMNTNLLVVLNDNHMAIDPNVGALNEYLLDITTSRAYNKLKEEIWNILGRIRRIGPNTQSLIQKIDSGFKSILLRQSNLFEALHFRYFGPVDGHDVNHLTKVLADLRNIPGPKLLHVLTKKGKGFRQAEIHQTAFHAPAKFDKKTGEFLKTQHTKPQPPKFQDVFGHTIVELAEKNAKIVGITPAMPSGSSLNLMMEKMPDRAFDVGIAEQHAVTFSAGMAMQGMIPFCNIYSTFMQRSFDQVIHDAALQKLPVVFCLDRGGLVGADGSTHHGAFDLAYMRIIPNMTVAAPMDEVELRNMMYTAQLPNKGTFSIRYPRGRGVILDWKQDFTEMEIGKGRQISAGNDIAILSIGAIGIEAKRAIQSLQKERISVCHYDMRFVKPIDKKILHEVFSKFTKILTIEDGTVVGGFGSAVIEFMSENGYASQVKRMGVPDTFIEHGTQDELYKECGYDANSIVVEVKNMLDFEKIVDTKRQNKSFVATVVK